MAGEGKKKELQLIPDESKRQATFLKRKENLLQKAYELTSLCGVEGCVIIYGPNDTQPEVWPCVEGADHVLAKFHSFPENVRKRRMTNHINEGCGKNVVVEGETSRTREAELEMLLRELSEADGDYDELIDSMSLEEMKGLYEFLDKWEGNNSVNDDNDEKDDGKTDIAAGNTKCAIVSNDEAYVKEKEEEKSSESVSDDKSN